MARYDLRISGEEFLCLTLRQFSAMVARRSQEKREWNYRFGVVAAASANPWRAKDSEPLQPHDFFPDLPEADETPTTSEGWAEFFSGLGEAARKKPE